MRHSNALLALLGAVTLSGSLAQQNIPAKPMTPPVMNTMSGPVMGKTTPRTYVLVHGALLGEFSWQRVERRLVADGNTVITVELPGHGADQTATDQITMQSYVDAVVKAIGTQSGVILVGHSFGGVVVSSVAEAVPSRIAKLVYVAALVPQDGESGNSVSSKDSGSLFGKYVTPTSSALVFSPDGLKPVFCNDCANDDVDLLRARLRPEPLVPFATPVRLTTARYGSVAKYDIITRLDRAVTYDLQKSFTGKVKFIRIFELNSGHLPFYTKPAELTRILESL